MDKLWTLKNSLIMTLIASERLL